jgi:hypothetical protein
MEESVLSIPIVGLVHVELEIATLPTRQRTFEASRKGNKPMGNTGWGVETLRATVAAAASAFNIADKH